MRLETQGQFGQMKLRLPGEFLSDSPDVRLVYALRTEEVPVEKVIRPDTLTFSQILHSTTGESILSWFEVSVDHYEIYRRSTAHFSQATQIATTAQLTYIDTEGNPEIDQYYWLRAIDFSGFTSKAGAYFALPAIAPRPDLMIGKRYTALRYGDTYRELEYHCESGQGRLPCERRA
jgi:hypothetical protein